LAGVNGGEKPLIDAWVRSGDDTVHTATIRLLGGRVYPFELWLAIAHAQGDQRETFGKPEFCAGGILPELG